MAVKEKDAIVWVCLSLKRIEKKEREMLSLRACVLVCVSVVVRMLMLKGNHVSGSVISDSELEAGKQNQTQLSREGRNYRAGMQT